MAVSRVGVGVATLNNCFYAVGGHDGRSYLNTVEVHSDESNVIFIKYIILLSLECLRFPFVPRSLGQMTHT